MSCPSRSRSALHAAAPPSRTGDEAAFPNGERREQGGERARADRSGTAQSQLWRCCAPVIHVRDSIGL